MSDSWVFFFVPELYEIDILSIFILHYEFQLLFLFKYKKETVSAEDFGMLWSAEDFNMPCTIFNAWWSRQKIVTKI